MKIISVINYKGGVGKTSLTANLAAQLAWDGKKVLMLDLDPQTSLTFSFVLPDVWEKDFSGELPGTTDKTIKAWLEAFDGPTPIKLTSLIHTPLRASRALSGVPSRIVLKLASASSGTVMLSDQAARSII